MNEPRPPSPRLAGSHYASEERARTAIKLARPLIETWRKNGNIVGSGFLYVVIMNPALHPGDCDFHDAILHEAAFGDPDGWDAPYDQFAREKAELSWRHGMDSRTVQASRPHLLRHGDTLLGGGICLDGIVVAASGAFPQFDEVFAGTVALWLRALSRTAYEKDLRENRQKAELTS
jgi:hypothetical protein